MKRFIVILSCLLCLCAIQAQGLRILFMGDSITDGAWGFANGQPSDKRNHTDYNHLYGHGYMEMCAAHFLAYYPDAGYQFFNRGISGHKLPDLEKRWQQDAIDVKPDILTVLIGINDVEWHNWNRHDQPFSVADWEKLYCQLLDRSLAANPKLKIILCTPFAANSGWRADKGTYDEIRQNVAQCAEAVRRIAKRYHATCLDYDAMFRKLQEKNHTGNREYWIWDGIHPTSAGHRCMADAWIKAFKKMK